MQDRCFKIEQKDITPEIPVYDADLDAQVSNNVLEMGQIIAVSPDSLPPTIQERSFLGAVLEDFKDNHYLPNQPGGLELLDKEDPFKARGARPVIFEKTPHGWLFWRAGWGNLRFGPCKTLTELKATSENFHPIPPSQPKA